MTGARVPPLGICAVITGMGCGGAERQMAMLTSGLTARGHKVGLAVLHGRDSFFDLDRRIDLHFFEREHLYRGVRALRFAARPGWLRRLLRDSELDVVVSFIDVANVHALLASRGLGMPVVVAERTHPPSHRIRWLERGLRRRLYPRAACVVVQTEATARWARDQGLGRSVEVIPNAVMPPPASAGLPQIDLPAGPVLVSMGRLDPIKRFDLVIDAFADVAPRHPEWHLLLLGDGPERGKLKERITRHGLGKRVGMPGTLTDPAAVLARCRMLVLASDFEGFPNALCEAMAHGLPVVATDCPVGPREIVRDGVDGMLVPPGDRAALAAALDQLMGDPAARDRLGRAATGIVDRCAPDKMLDRWEELLVRVRDHGR